MKFHINIFIRFLAVAIAIAIVTSPGVLLADTIGGKSAVDKAQELTIKKINSNFRGYHVRYKKGNDGQIFVIYSLPHDERKGVNGEIVKMQGIIIIIAEDGDIMNIKPLEINSRGNQK